MKRILITLVALLPMLSCSNSATTSSDVKSLDESIMTRRSIRQYTDRQISRETLEEIVTAGINAPNGQGRQAYEIRVAGPEFVQAISDAVTAENPAIAKRPGFRNIFVNAPYVIFIAADTSYDLSQVDCGLLGENIILSAWNKGIGSCCLGQPIRMMKSTAACGEFLARLDFSEGYELLYCIGLGYPAEEPDARPRKTEMIQYLD